MLTARDAGARLVKIHEIRDGKYRAVGADQRKEFMAQTFELNSLTDLQTFVDQAAERNNRFIIRGTPKPEINLEEPVLRQKVYFDDMPVQWVMLDIDGIEYDSTLWNPYEEPDAFFESFISTLSEDLEDVSFYWRFSGSAGINTGQPEKATKAHIWFWLDRGYTSDELKRWAEKVNGAHGGKIVDPAVLRTVQPHYVSPPVIGEGVGCQVVRRSGLVELGEDVATLQIPAGKQGRILEGSAYRYDGTGDRKSFEEWLPLIGDHEDGHGFYDPMVGAVCAYVFHEGEDADYDFVRQVIGDAAAGANRQFHTDEYVRQKIEDWLPTVIEWAGMRWREGGGTAGKNDDGAVLETDVSVPYFPRPRFGQREGIERQNRAIGGWMEQAVRRAAYHKLQSAGATEGIGPSGYGITDASPIRLQITGPVGSGKTHSVEQSLLDLNAFFLSLPGMADETLTVYFCAGLSEKAAESAWSIVGQGGDAIAVRGVGAPDPETPGSNMCLRSDMALKVQASEGVLSAICKTCSLRFNCGFQKQKRDIWKAFEEPGVKIFTGPHEYLNYPSQVGTYDLVIVDERYKAEMTPRKFDRTILTVDLDSGSLEYVPLDMDEEPEKVMTDDGRIKIREPIALVDAVRTEVYRGLMEAPHAVLAAVRDRWVPGHATLTKALLRRVLNVLHQVAEARKPFTPDREAKFNVNSTDERIIEELDKRTDHDSAANIAILEAIYAEWEAPRPQANTIRVEDGRVIVRGVRAPTKVAAHTPVLLLDATAKLGLNRKLWGPDLAEERVDIENRVSAVQVWRHSWSKASFIRLDEHGNRIGHAQTKLEEIARVINRYPGAFLACPLDVERAIKPYLSVTVKTGHYNNLRGLNTFADCETGFFLCDPMVRPESALELALAYGAKDEQAHTLEDYRVERRRLRMRDPDEIALLDAPVNPNPVLEMFRQILVEDEMLQALGRVRGFWNDRQAFILANRVYDQTIDGYIHWEEFLAGSDRSDLFVKRVQKDFGGMFVNSPSWLVNVCPEVTRTRATARKILSEVIETHRLKPVYQTLFTPSQSVFDVLSLINTPLLFEEFIDVFGTEYTKPVNAVVKKFNLIEQRASAFVNWAILRCDGVMPMNAKVILDMAERSEELRKIVSSETTFRKIKSQLYKATPRFVALIYIIRQQTGGWTFLISQFSADFDLSPYTDAPISVYEGAVLGQKRQTKILSFTSDKERIRRSLRLNYGMHVGTLTPISADRNDDTAALLKFSQRSAVVGINGDDNEEIRNMEESLSAPKVFSEIDGKPVRNWEEVSGERTDREHVRAMLDELKRDNARTRAEAIDEEREEARKKDFYDFNIN